MHEIVIASVDLMKERIFLATADSAVHHNIRNYHSELALQIRLLTILGYEVVTGAPFVWQSSATREAFQSIAPLYEARLVGLMGRPGVSSARDYLAERQADTSVIDCSTLPYSSPFRTEVPSFSAIDEARSIDCISSLIPRTGSVETLFQRFFMQDLNEEARKLSFRKTILNHLPTMFSAIARRRAEVVSLDLGQLPIRGHFSRATIQAALLSHELPESLIDSLCCRTTGLYHGANAIACDANLFTSYRFSPYVPDGISQAHELSLSPWNPYLFMRVLQIFGISRSTIQSLSLQKLRRIVSEAGELQAFSMWYKSFIRSCIPTDCNDCTTLRDYLSVLKAIEERRTATLDAQASLSRINRLERLKLDWVIRAIWTLVGLKYGKGWLITAPFAAGAFEEALDTLRRRCERTLNKPLGDFEAMIIREGLRDFKPNKEITN